MFSFLKPNHCDGCTQPFPAHALIGIHNDRYCVRCAKNVDKNTYYCDGCGEDYPITHLQESEEFEGYFCRRCIV